MPDENKSKKTWTDKLQDLESNPQIKKTGKFFSRYAKEIISGTLVLSGIIISSISWMGGLFVACGATLCFNKEICYFLSDFKKNFLNNGPIRNSLLFALLFYFSMNMFIFTITFIVLCLIIGFVLNKKNGEEG